MNSSRPLFLLPWVAVVLLSSPGCIQVPDIEPAKAEVRITSPDGLAYTNGVLEVRLAVTGHAPERVELLLDGEVLAEVAAPYTYAWDTAAVAEGMHQLVARAVFGDVVFASEAREVVVDRTPPQVVSRTPEPGAQDVWVKSPIQAVFSEPVKASSLNEASVRLTVGGVEVARTVSLSADGRTVTVEPETGYAPSNSFTLEITPQATDLAGNSVAPLAASWTWLVPYWIPWGSANGAITASHSDSVDNYVHDSSGALTALWHISSGSGPLLFVKRFEDGEWKIFGNALLSTSSAWEIGPKSLMLDGNKNPIVGWSRTLDGSSYTISAKKWSTNHWESLGEALPNSPEFPNKKYFDLQLTPLGKPAITWSESSDTTTRICTSEWDSTNWKSVGECFNAQSTSHWYTNPTLRFSPTGVPTVSWFGSQPTIYNIFTSQLIDSKWTLLEGDYGTDIQDPHVSMTFDSNGLPIIAWMNSNGSGDYTLVTERWHGNEWRTMGGRPQSPLGTIGLYNHSIQMDAAGTPFVAWSDRQVHVQRWDGTSWQSLDDASNSEVDGYTTYESLQRLPSGEFILTWFRSAGYETRVRVRRLNQ